MFEVINARFWFLQNIEKLYNDLRIKTYNDI